MFGRSVFGGGNNYDDDMFSSMQRQMINMMQQQQQQQQQGSSSDGHYSYSSYSSSRSNHSGYPNGHGESITTTTRMVNGKRQTITERTIVKPDGSVERHVETTGDNNFPSMLDQEQQPRPQLPPSSNNETNGGPSNLLSRLKNRRRSGK
jgi:hypothetical protein